MQVLESAIERECVTIAQECGCLLIKIKAVRGFPDRMLLAPGARVIYMEFKRPGEDLRPLQYWYRELLERLDFQCTKVQSVEQFKRCLMDLHLLSGTPTATKRGGSTG